VIQLYMFEEATTIVKVFYVKFWNGFYKISQIGPNRCKFNGWRTQPDSCRYLYLQITPWITQLANMYFDLHNFENDNYLVSTNKQLDFRLQKVHFFEPDLSVRRSYRVLNLFSTCTRVRCVCKSHVVAVTFENLQM
jgi:hypothetical protein